MNTEKFIIYSRGSFALLRWAPLAAAVALPFNFGEGLIPLPLFLGAVLIAVIWLMSLLLAWRTRNQFWLFPGYLALTLGSRVIGVDSSEVPSSQGLQWICIVVILACAPLLLFRARLFQFARLNEPVEAA